MANCGPGTFEMAFNVSNPEAVSWADAHGAQLIRQVTDDTKAAVRAIIADALSDGLAPRESAKLIKNVVGLTTRQARAVRNLRKTLVKRGVKADKLDARLARYAQKLRRQRSLVIARTETMRAANEGQRQLWRQAKQLGYLGSKDRRRWSVTPDERLCEICGPMAGATAPIDSDRWTRADGSVVTMPLPAHPQCRCVPVIQLVS